MTASARRAAQLGTSQPGTGPETPDLVDPREASATRPPKLPGNRSAGASPSRIDLRQPRPMLHLIPGRARGPRLRGEEEPGQSHTDAGCNSHPGKNPSQNPCAGGSVLQMDLDLSNIAFHGWKTVTERLHVGLDLANDVFHRSESGIDAGAVPCHGTGRDTDNVVVVHRAFLPRRQLLNEFTTGDAIVRRRRLGDLHAPRITDSAPARRGRRPRRQASAPPQAARSVSGVTWAMVGTTMWAVPSRLAA